MEKEKLSKCCICGNYFEGHGNNPDPVIIGKNKKCCNFCDTYFVIPARETEEKCQTIKSGLQEMKSFQNICKHTIATTQS